MDGVDKYDVPTWKLQVRFCKLCASLVAVPTNKPDLKSQTIKMGCPSCDRVAPLRPIAGDRPREERMELLENRPRPLGDYEYGDGGRSTGSHARRPSAQTDDDEATADGSDTEQSTF